jgi:adenine phosphoribosyltransferase
VAVFTDRYPVAVGAQEVELPLARIADDLAIALLITVDWGVGFMERAGEDLAELLRPHEPDIVATNATLGIPVAVEVSRALGLDDYLALQKSPKIHLADAFVQPLTSITSRGRQELRLDRARVGAVAGRRVALVDDVISTGETAAAAIRLLREVDADVVAVGVLLTEGRAWAGALGEDARLVRSLGSIPVFRRVAGGWSPVEDDGMLSSP